jgi:hypothetical protein
MTRRSGARKAGHSNKLFEINNKADVYDNMAGFDSSFV